MCVAPAHRLRASNAVARCRPRPPRAGPELALHNAVSSRLAQSDCLSRRPRMLRAVRRSLLAAMAATVAVALACNRDAESPPPASPNAWLTDIGGLVVSTATTGSSIDPNGYVVVVDNTQRQSIAPSGVVVFTGLAPGQHTVALTDVASNCTVSTPLTVMVSLLGSGTAAFPVSCAPAGDLTVSASTTGSNLDPDGYTVTLDGNASTSQPLATNGGTATFNAVAAGSHSVALSGVATNCTVSGPNPQSVTVPAGGTASASFTVNCTALVSRITGVGQIFTGPASPGSDAKTFDFDVQAGPSGRVKYTDWHEVFPNGMPLTLIVDPSDAGTAITAFRTSSSTCHTATGGAEFDAIGRINDATGTLVTFTMIACDSTTDANYLRVEIPSFGYSRAGVLTSGEIDRTGP